MATQRELNLARQETEALLIPLASRLGDRRHPVRALDALIRLGPITAAAQDLGAYLVRVAEAACTALDFGVCLIYLRDPSDDSYYVEATRGVGDDERDVLLSAPVPAHVLGALTMEDHQLAHGFGYYIRGDDHVWHDPLVAQCFTMAAPCLYQRSWQQGDLFLVPLPDGDGPPSGFMVLDEPLDGHQPSDDTVLGAVTLAKGCADAVLSTQVQRVRGEKVAVATALLRIAEAVETPDPTLLVARAARTLAQVLDADHCAVWEVAADDVLLHVIVDALGWSSVAGLATKEWISSIWSRPNGLHDAVARGEPALFDRPGGAGLATLLGLDAALLIPLSAHGDTHCRGAIVVGWTRGPRPLRPRDIDIARGVSSLVGTALRNALLYQETLRQSTRSAQLYSKEHDAVQRLRALDDLRNDFVSTISHELRTPLTGIKGYTDSLMSYWDRMDDDRRRAAVAKISFSTERLNRLIKDLLFISRVESGTLPLECVVASLDEPIAAAVHAVTQSFTGQRIEVRPPREAVRVLADMDRVEQVVTNLLDNGAKYSCEGQPMRISWARRGDRVLILVADRGPGLSAEDQKKLFARFGKLGHTPRAGHVGTGLGLYISRNLVEAMGGSLRVRSLLGRGSVFAVTLPVAPEASTAEREG